MNGTRDFAMPSLGADMTQGRITEWLVRPGDHVDRGQIVVVVQTDKSDIDVELFESATVAELLASVGDTVPVGAPIATIVPDAVAADRAPGQPTLVRPTTPPTTAPPAVRVTSPVLRHLADELRVDTALLDGSGAGGRVHRADIERVARPAGGLAGGPRFSPRARRLLAEHRLSATRFAGRSTVTGDDVLGSLGHDVADGTIPESPPADRVGTRRRRIAASMERSWREIPHYHVSRTIDLEGTARRLAVVNADRPPAERIVPTAFLLCAAARAAAEVGECNGWWVDGRFEPADRVDLGIVVSLRAGGIVVPVVARADELEPEEMMRRSSELVRQARSGRLRSSDVGTASITVTNLGDRGADAVFGIIHAPQVALVGFGAVRVRPWVDADGAVVARPVAEASLSGDHRATDGLTGSRLLARIQTVLDGDLASDLDGGPGVAR